MQETLRLDITADNREAIAVLKQTENQLKVFERALAKATDPKQLIYLQKNIDFLKGKMTSLAQATPKLVNNTNQAANALTNLGRVAQDAPFGFIGIQNNLNPLLESFQRLKSESGSTGGALKALAGSLIGPAGLGLALSVGSALLLTFGDRLFNTKKVTDETAKSMDEFRGSAAKELIKFRELTVAAADANVPLWQRKNAVDELQKNYSAYLGNLSQEDILSGKIGNAYTKITDALKAKIALQAAEEKLVPIIKEQLAVAEKIADAQKKVNSLQGIGNKEMADGAKFAAATGKLNPFLAMKAEAIAAAAEIEKLSPVYTELENKITRVFQSMQPFIAASAGLNTSINNTGKEAKYAGTELEKYLATREIISKAGFKPVTGVPLTAGVQGQTGVASKENVQLEQSALMTKEQLILKNVNAQKLYNEQQAQANELANIGAGVFTDLGNAMLTGQDMGEALSNTFKKLAADLAQMVIKALIFKAIMAAITGGGSAVTSGATAGMSIFNGMSFADGGIASGPKSGYPALLHGTEAVLNPGQFKNLTSNMMNMGAMQGKSNDSGGFVASTSIRGSEMLLMIKRAEANMGLKRG